MPRSSRHRRLEPTRTSLGALALAHAYILGCAILGLLQLGDILWLYWGGNACLVASMGWRMRRSPSMRRGDSVVELGIFAAMHVYLGYRLWIEGHGLSWTPGVAFALASIAASALLDLRRQFAFDGLEAPDLLHFAGLWIARMVPFALLFALPDKSAKLLGVLWAIASVDVVMHLVGPSFGRTLTVWQQKRQTKSSNNYLKWYKPEEWKDR